MSSESNKAIIKSLITINQIPQPPSLLQPTTIIWISSQSKDSVKNQTKIDLLCTEATPLPILLTPADSPETKEKDILLTPLAPKLPGLLLWVLLYKKDKSPFFRPLTYSFFIPLLTTLPSTVSTIWLNILTFFSKTSLYILNKLSFNCSIIISFFFISCYNWRFNWSALSTLSLNSFI